MLLVQVPFRKIRNLVHLTDFNHVNSLSSGLKSQYKGNRVGKGTCPGAGQSLVQVHASTWLSARTGHSSK